MLVANLGRWSLFIKHEKPRGRESQKMTQADGEKMRARWEGRKKEGVREEKKREIWLLIGLSAFFMDIFSENFILFSKEVINLHRVYAVGEIVNRQEKFIYVL